MLLALSVLSVTVNANQAPVVTVQQGGEPLVIDYGSSIELPIQVSDADGDALTLFYKLDNDGEWHQLPASQTVNIVPGAIFADLAHDVHHTLSVYASDGELSSNVVTLDAPDDVAPRVYRRKKGRRRGSKKYGKRSLGKGTGFGEWKPEEPDDPNPCAPIPGPVEPGEPPPCEASIGPPAPGKTFPGEPPDYDPFPGGKPGFKEPYAIGVESVIESLSSHAVDISYSFDDSGVWSTPESYPLGAFEIMIPHQEFDQYLNPGDHKIAFRYEEAGKLMNTDEWAYSINQPPTLQVTSDKPLTLSGAPAGPVALPLEAADADSDAVSLWYRFNGEGDWTYVPSGLGVNVLPQDAFKGLANGHTGFVEVAAWDGYDHSEEPVRIGFEVEAEPDFFGAISPGAFAGVLVAAVVVLAVAVTLIVLAVRKKAESSSTGLIESE